MSYEEYLNSLIKYYKTLKLSKGFSDYRLLLDEMINIFVRMLNKNNDVTFTDIDKIILSNYNNWQEKHLVNLFSNDINRLATFQ